MACGKNDPLILPKCECYYEYKGEICLGDSKLEIKIALCPTIRAYLKRVISDLTGIQNPPKREEEKIEFKLIQETERQLFLLNVS